VKNLSQQLPCSLGVPAAPNLLAADQPSTEGLPKRLPKEAARDRIRFEEIENRPKGTRELEALRGFNIARRQVSAMQDESTGGLAIPAKVHGNGHMQLRRIEVREVVKAESGLVAVNALRLLVPVSGPQSPEYKVRMLFRWEQREAVNATMLANPVSGTHVIRVGTRASGRR